MLPFAGLNPSQAAAAGPTTGRWVLGFFPYYQADLYPPDRVDFAHLTHIATGNVFPSPDGGCCVAASDDARSWERYAKDLNRRAHGQGVTTMLWIGGSDSKPGPWRHNTASQAASDQFATATVEYARRLGYDGVDLDWEDGIDGTRIGRFATSLRAAWPSAVLSFDTGPYDFVGARKVAASVNRVNVMSYIAPGHWEGWDGPWHQSPLYGDTDAHPYSIDAAVKKVEGLGVPADKVTVGIGFFGSGWSDTSPKDGDCPTGPIGFAGENYGPTVTDSQLPLSKVESKYVPAMERHWDDSAHVPYLVAPASTLGGRRPAGIGNPKVCYVSYDDQQSIGDKGAYIKSQQLGGVIIWTVPQGYDTAAGTNQALVWVSEAVS